MAPKSDIEIARAATMQPVGEIGAKLGIPADSLLHYGPYKAKLSADYINLLPDKMLLKPNLTWASCMNKGNQSPRIFRRLLSGIGLLPTREIPMLNIIWLNSIKSAKLPLKMIKRH